VSHPLTAVAFRLRGFADALASVLIPAPCRICGRVLDSASRIPICAMCLGTLTPYGRRMCQSCGRPLASSVFVEGAANPLCFACRRGLYHFDLARSYGEYSEAMAKAVILLKYHRVTPLSAWFAARLAETVAQDPSFEHLDAVVPVPQHPSRLKERGYNQAELIARPLAKLLSLPLCPFLLVRTRPRPDQLRLTLRERWTTVRGAYAVHETAKVDNLRV
jgi:predicted amidophosphoribosyltransferase